MVRHKTAVVDPNIDFWIDANKIKERNTVFANASARKCRELCLRRNYPIPQNSDVSKSVVDEREDNTVDKNANDNNEQNNDLMVEQVQRDEEHDDGGRGTKKKIERKRRRERRGKEQLEKNRGENMEGDYDGREENMEGDNDGREKNMEEENESGGEENMDEESESGGEENMEDDNSFPFLGGPMVNDVLVDYKEHFAHRVWQEEERGVQRLVCHLTQLKKWPLEKQDPKFINKLKEIGLYWVAVFPYKHMNPTLVCAFVERWYPETNTFHLPFREMTITLDDVEQLLGIPIVGTPIVSEQNKLDLNMAIKLFNRGLGVNDKEAELELS